MGLGVEDFRLIQLLKTENVDLCEVGLQVQLDLLGSQAGKHKGRKLRDQFYSLERKTSLHTMSRKDILLAIL